MIHSEADIVIRKISTEDRVPLASVFRETFAGPPWNEQWSQEAALNVLDEWLPMPQFYGLIAMLGPKPVGFVFGRFETWDSSRLFYVKELCVLPENQRAGIGSALTTALLGTMRERQVGSLYLLTLKDSPAAAFYASNGFRVSESTVVFTKRIQ